MKQIPEVSFGKWGRLPPHPEPECSRDCRAPEGRSRGMIPTASGKTPGSYEPRALRVCSQVCSDPEKFKQKMLQLLGHTHSHIPDVYDY